MDLIDKKTEYKRPRYYAMSPDAVLKLGDSIEDKTAQATFFFTYMVGGRINEVTDFTPSRLDIHDDRVLVRLKTLKQKHVDSMRRVPIPLGSLAKCHENEMWKVVSNYLAGYTIQDHPFKKWGNMSVYLRRNITLITEARIRTPGGDYTDRVIEKPFHPHYLRHARATHLAEYYGFGTQQLCLFFGWANPAVALLYTKSADLWKAFDKS